MINFAQRHRVAPVFNYESATTDRTSVSIDRRGYASVAFVVHTGNPAGLGGVQIKVEGSADNSSWHELQGVSVDVAAADIAVPIVIEIANAADRYLRLAITKNGETCSESALCYLFRGTAEPVDQPADLTRTSYFHAPVAAS